MDFIGGVFWLTIWRLIKFFIIMWLLSIIIVNPFHLIWMVPVGYILFVIYRWWVSI